MHRGDLQPNGGKRGGYFEGVDAFTYLGRVLHWTDSDWPEVLRKTRRARLIWGRLGKLMRREGAYPITLETFYRAVVQAVLLFGAKAWVLLAEILNNLEGVHVGFL